jgi:hypothetical protein
MRRALLALVMGCGCGGSSLMDSGAGDAGWVSDSGQPSGADSGTTVDAGPPDAGPPTTHPLTVTVEIQRNTVRLTQAFVTVDAQHQGRVDSKGQISWTDLPFAPLTISVTAPTCNPATQAISSTATAVTVGMVCPAPLTPPPSRDQILAVHSDWGNLWDAQNRPILTPFILALAEQGDLTSAKDWVNRIQAAGDTHLVVQLTTPHFPGYPISGVGFENNLSAFKAYLVDLIQLGFVPVVMLGDGQTANNKYTGTAGSDWVLANVGAVAAAMKSGVDVTPYCLWVPGWRVIGSSGYPGGDWDGVWWSPDQIQSVAAAMRTAFGDAVQIGVSFGMGYIHLGNGPADWQVDPGLISTDVFLVTMPQPVLPDTTGAQQIASRVLGPVATNIGPGNAGPWYFSAARPRGPLSIVAFDTCAYDATHGNINATQVKQINDAIAGFGFQNLGNGQP